MSSDEKSPSELPPGGTERKPDRDDSQGNGPRSGLGRSTTLGSLVGGLGASLLGAFVRKPFQNEERRAG
ncbi:MAG: hypothetical protein KDK25_07145, partial [Leptospiraceae bacterium]|nr:hypothetical protein [Leptospiraceae bacterium]